MDLAVLLPPGEALPNAKMISFNRAQPFAIRAHYDLDTPADLLPPAFDKQLGVFSVGPFQVGCTDAVPCRTMPGCGQRLCQTIRTSAVNLIARGSATIAAVLAWLPSTVQLCRSPVQVPAGAETAKLKVKISLNLHGLVAVEQVQAIEELEEEVRRWGEAP